MDEIKLAKFKKAIADALQQATDGLTKEEFVSAFKSAMDLIAKTELALLKKIDGKISDTSAETEKMRQMMTEMRSQFLQTIKETKSANETTFAGIKQRAMESMQAMFSKMDIQGQMSAMKSEHSAMMQKMDSAMPDTEKMMTEMMAKMPPETPESVRDKLESIQEEESKLAISAIAHLEEKLKDLEKKVGARVGSVGGFNYGALQLHLVDDESVVGTIDGVNTVFTINNPPSPVSSLKVYRGGARQRITEDYTFSGVTITFLVAPQVGEILLADYRL